MDINRRNFLKQSVKTAGLAAGIAVVPGAAFASKKGEEANSIVHFDGFSNGTVKFVSKEGNDSNDGKSWATSKLTVRAAVESLPETGAGKYLRREGVIYIGPGVFEESGNGLAAGEPVIECSAGVHFIGQGTVAGKDKKSGTQIKLSDSTNRHLFGPRSTFRDWSHHITFKDLVVDGNKANNTGNFDCINLRGGGFNCALYNVFAKNAPRSGVYLSSNGVNFYMYNCTMAGCADGGFQFHRSHTSNTTNIGLYGIQIDDCGDYAIRIIDDSDGMGVFFINGLETEALKNDNQHKAVIHYDPRDGANGMNCSFHNIFGYKGDSPRRANQGVIEVASGSGANPILHWLNVVPDGYDFVINHKDRKLTSTVKTEGWVASGTSHSVYFNGATIHTGNGSPENSVKANVGSLFLRTDGGAGKTLYIKESGTGKTGWVAK